METVLGRTGLTVSRACLGTMTFGSQVDEAVAGRMLDLCFDRGVRFFDTANVYNAGASEEILGGLLAGRRHDVVLASKCGMKVDDVAGLSAAAVARACEDSLRRLRTDYLDLYYLHLPDTSVPIEETLEATDRLVRAGKVRHAAASNFASWQTIHMLWIAAERGWAAPMVSQPMYNVLARGIEQEFLPMCRRFGIATVVYNPLAGGLLTGKQNPGAPLGGTRFDNNALYLERYWKQRNFGAVDALRTAAETAGRGLIDLSLNWLLHHAGIDCIILGASKLEQLRQNLDALERGPLPAELLSACDAVWMDLRGPAPKYNR